MYSYILEIKNRCILIITSWFFSILFCYLYKEILFFLLVKTNKELYNKISFYFISTNLTEIFEVYLKVSYFFSIQVVLFLLTYHLFRFVCPALFLYEYNKLKNILAVSISFYLLSLVFFIKAILPLVWVFFFNFQNYSGYEVNVFFEARLNDYLQFYIDVYILVIFIGQMFFVITVFLMFVPNKINFILKTRKIFYSSFLVIATLLTPPDVVSQIVLTILFISIYEFLVVLFFLKEQM